MKTIIMKINEKDNENLPFAKTISIREKKCGTMYIDKLRNGNYCVSIDESPVKICSSLSEAKKCMDENV